MGYHLIFAACPLDFYIESNNRKLLISILTNLTLARVVWQLLASEYSRRNSVSRTVVQINTLGAVCGRKARMAQDRVEASRLAFTTEGSRVYPAAQMNLSELFHNLIRKWMGGVGSLTGTGLTRYLHSVHIRSFALLFFSAYNKVYKHLT